MSVVAVVVCWCSRRCCLCCQCASVGVARCFDQYGYTALLLACHDGHLDVARWLVTDAGSDARLERTNVGWCWVVAWCGVFMLLEVRVASFSSRCVVVRTATRLFWRHAAMVSSTWLGGW
jgi:hypothetical protein